jgi:ribosomal protein S18 acetylase RimI-like enzyme
MPSVSVRPFQRADRDQVTALVNAHAAAVVPGVVASVNAVLTQFEREPDEVIVGPWVAERQVLVAEQEGGVAAAALLCRYRDAPDVGGWYRNAGEVRWLVFRPLAPAGNPHWRDGQAAARMLMDACLTRMRAWRVVRVMAAGDLPVPGVYGVPQQWPHVEQLYREVGFRAPAAAVEVVHVADLAGLPLPGNPPLPGLALTRSVGINGTRFAAVLEAEEVGYVEVAVLDTPERLPRQGGLADIGNLHVASDHRGVGVGTWLVAHAARWLRLGHVDRLLHYSGEDDQAGLAFVENLGFVEVTRTRRGWVLAGP